MGSDLNVEIDHEKNLRSFSSLSLNHSRRVGVNYKFKYVHEVLVNFLFKLARKKVLATRLRFYFKVLIERSNCTI